MDRGLPQKLSRPDAGPDLELLIRRVASRDPAALRLEIHAPNAALGVNHRRFGSIALGRSTVLDADVANLRESHVGNDAVASLRVCN